MTEFYPPADRDAQWFEATLGGAKMDTHVVVLHTTEGTSWDPYQNGATAPNLTAMPDFSIRKLRWRQHFRANTSSRALRNLDGGVETNTLNAVQVELVGTCSPAKRNEWDATGRRHVYWPDPPDWAIRDLAAFFVWAHDELGVPYTMAPLWLPYPASYGDTKARMSDREWREFSGFCGHAHVPENLHGDPGALPVDKIMALIPFYTPGMYPIKVPAATEETDVALADEIVRAIAQALADPASALGKNTRRAIREAVQAELTDEATGKNTAGRPRI